MQEDQFDSEYCFVGNTDEERSLVWSDGRYV